MTTTKSLSSIPPIHSPSTIRPGIHSQITSSASTPILIILDDDPTGTQTCHDINVLATWSTSVLTSELLSTPPGSGFFIMTKQPCLAPARSTRPHRRNMLESQACSWQAGRKVDIILRSVSTLRGHFQLELKAAEEVLGRSDVWILCPFFEQGRRCTFEDVHYVAQGDVLVPVSFLSRRQELAEWYMKLQFQEAR